jgi:hypothetical protein
MLVDTDAIRALGAACSAQADDLSAAAAALTSLMGPDATAAFGPSAPASSRRWMTRPLAHAQAITALSADVASAHPVSARRGRRVCRR